MFVSHLGEEEGVSKVTRNINRIKMEIPICLSFLMYKDQKCPSMSCCREWDALGLLPE